MLRRIHLWIRKLLLAVRLILTYLYSCNSGLDDKNVLIITVNIGLNIDVTVLVIQHLLNGRVMIDLSRKRKRKAKEE